VSVSTFDIVNLFAKLCQSYNV